MKDLLAVMAGGAVGSGARYLVSLFSLRALGAAWPWGTLAVNVLGSLLLALLVPWIAARSGMPEPIKLLLTVGVCGGFTTYSTFNHETLKLLHEGRTGHAIAYMAATAVLCLAVGLAGLRLSQAVLAAP